MPSLRLPRPGWPMLLALFCATLMTARSQAASDALDLAAYRGKVVVVDFWASWCTPCQRSFSWLNDMRARYGERGLVVLGVNTDAARPDAERFMASVPAHFPVIFDPEGRLAAIYKLPGMPTSLIFDRQGQLQRTHIGFREAKRTMREREIIAVLTEVE